MNGCARMQLGGQPGACTLWSSPLFFTVNAAGAGATLGASEIASIVVLDTPEACDAFLRTQVHSKSVQTVLSPFRPRTYPRRL